MRRRFLQRACLIAASAALLQAGVAARAFAQNGPDLRLLQCDEHPAGPLPGKLLLHVGVKNGGDVQALDATLHVKFLDDAGALLNHAIIRLDTGRIGTGAEERFIVTIPECPAYRRIVPALFWSVGALPMTAGDAGAEADLEVGGCRFLRFSNGDVLAAGVVRNGRAKAATDIAVTLSFQSAAGQEVKTATRRLRGTLPPGGTTRFAIRMSEFPAVAAFASSVSGKDVSGEAGSAPAEDANLLEEGLGASSVREKAPALGGPAVGEEREKGVGAVLGAPPAAPTRGDKPGKKGGQSAETPAAQSEPPAAEGVDAPAYLIQASGMAWVNGTYKTVGTSNNYQYTGDTAFLKMKFFDAKGNAARPDAAVTVKIVDRKLGKVTSKHAITKATWKLDAEKINVDNVSPDIVAWHDKDKALWVGLARVDDSQKAEFTLDISVEIKKLGAWTWTGLRDPFAINLSPPSPPEKPEKKK